MTITLSKGALIASHRDADGIFSAALALSAYPSIGEVHFPHEFGEVTDEELTLDMVPINPEYEGTVIDHHPQHAERPYKYTLINLGVPTSLAVWQIWKDQIPKHLWWRAAAGTAGDGQPELIPGEIWRSRPELLDSIIKSYVSYGKIKTYPTPLWMGLSAAVNSVSRAMGPEGYKMAFNLAVGHTDPLSLLRDPVVLKAKTYQEAEVQRIFKDYQQIDLGRFIFWEIRTKMTVESIVAMRAEQASKKTTLVVNAESGKISMRGVLVSLLVEELKAKGFTVGGHAGFSGGSLKSGQEPSTLLTALRGIKL